MDSQEVGLSLFSADYPLGIKVRFPRVSSPLWRMKASIPQAPDEKQKRKKPKPNRNPVLSTPDTSDLAWCFCFFLTSYHVYRKTR